MKATIPIKSLKVAVPLTAADLPADLVPPDGPAGDPIVELVLEGGSFRAQARLNGKNYRKVMKMITEHGAANVSVCLQATLRPPPAKGAPYVLDSAGFQAFPKVPKVADVNGEPPPQAAPVAAEPTRPMTLAERVARRVGGATCES